MTKKKRRSSMPGASTDSLNAVCMTHVYMTHYEVTDEPIQDPYYRRLPNHIKDAVERLHQESQTNPRQAIPELRELIERYPRLPQFYNYLTVAYARIGENGKAEAVTRASIRENPDYLFARLNYAEFGMVQ